MVVLSREFVSQPVDALEILHAFHQAVCHLLLTGTQRHARIVVLLVGLLRPLGVSNLGLQIVLVLLLVVITVFPLPARSAWLTGFRKP